jgi:hypothetical protein
VLCPDMVNSGACRNGDACDKSHSVSSCCLQYGCVLQQQKILNATFSR